MGASVPRLPPMASAPLSCPISRVMVLVRPGSSQAASVSRLRLHFGRHGRPVQKPRFIPRIRRRPSPASSRRAKSAWWLCSETSAFCRGAGDGAGFFVLGQSWESKPQEADSLLRLVWSPLRPTSWSGAPQGLTHTRRWDIVCAALRFPELGGPLPPPPAERSYTECFPWLLCHAKPAWMSWRPRCCSSSRGPIGSWLMMELEALVPF